MKRGDPMNPDTVDKAKGLYFTLVGLTESPAEAMQIIKVMHILLWLNGRSENSSVDTMLNDYTTDFKDNLRLNGEVESLEQ